MTTSAPLRDRRWRGSRPYPFPLPLPFLALEGKGRRKKEGRRAFVALLGIKRYPPPGLRDVAFRRGMAALLMEGSPL